MKNQIEVKNLQNPQLRAINNTKISLNREQAVVVADVLAEYGYDVTELNKAIILESANSQAHRESMPYGLTDEQYRTLEAVADTLFALTDNQNPNEKDRGKTAMINSLAMLCDQLDTVLSCEGAFK